MRRRSSFLSLVKKIFKDTVYPTPRIELNLYVHRNLSYYGAISLLSSQFTFQNMSTKSIITSNIFTFAQTYLLSFELILLLPR